MQNHEVNPVDGCMLSLRVIEGYDPLNRVVEVFSQCTLAKLRTDFWDMLKIAVLDDESFPDRHDISMATCVYENMSDLLTALWLFAKKQGLQIRAEQAPVAFFAQCRYKAHPLDTMKAICSAFEPYEVREELWKMFQSALTDKGPNQEREERRNMIGAFEHVTDLVHAAYVIVSEKSGVKEKKQKTR